MKVVQLGAAREQLGGQREQLGLRRLWPGPLGIRVDNEASACASKYALQLPTWHWPGLLLWASWLATNDSVGTGHAHYVPSGGGTTRVKLLAKKLI